MAVTTVTKKILTLEQEGFETARAVLENNVLTEIIVYDKNGVIAFQYPIDMESLNVLKIFLTNVYDQMVEDGEEVLP